MRTERYLAIGAMIAVAMGIVPARAGTIQVTIDKMAFAPVEVKARVGDTIEWINKGILAHTATVKGEWDVVIPAKKSASFVLKRAGDVEYYCRFHPNMKARISVAPK